MTPKLKTGDNYNRIFILGGKECSEQEMKSMFAKFGDVKDIHIIRDKKTSESKGTRQKNHEHQNFKNIICLLIRFYLRKSFGCSCCQFVASFCIDHGCDSVRFSQSHLYSALYLSIFQISHLFCQDSYEPCIGWGQGQLAKLALTLKLLSLTTHLNFFVYVWFADFGCVLGITYVTYSRASEAALAIEEMNGKPVGDNPRPMKVLFQTF